MIMNLYFLSSKDCDLTIYQSTFEYFNKLKADFVIHLAANVGGLYKNLNFKIDILEQN
jgi:GDP-L-fucose synthase